MAVSVLSVDRWSESSHNDPWLCECAGESLGFYRHAVTGCTDGVHAADELSSPDERRRRLELRRTLTMRERVRLHEGRLLGRLAELGEVRRCGRRGAALGSRGELGEVKRVCCRKEGRVRRGHVVVQGRERRGDARLARLPGGGVERRRGRGKHLLGRSRGFGEEHVLDHLLVLVHGNVERLVLAHVVVSPASDASCTATPPPIKVGSVPERGRGWCA